MIDIDEHPIHLGCRFASTRTDLTNTPPCLRPYQREIHLKGKDLKVLIL